MVTIWIVAPGGFISVVEYDPTKTRNKKSKHATVENDLENYHAADSKTLSTHLMVRARVRDDLNFLEDAAKQLGEKVEVYEDLKADYQWRCIVSRTLLKHAVNAQIDGIDYWSHVKESLTSRMPKLPAGSSAVSRHSALMGFWNGHASWQENPPYGTFRGSSTVAGSYASKTVFSKDTKTTYEKVNGEWRKKVPYVAPTTYYSYKGGYVSPYGNGGWYQNSNHDSTSSARSWDENDSTLKGLIGQPNTSDDSSVSYTDNDEPDNPVWGMSEWQIAIAAGDISHSTMLEQVKDLLSTAGESGDVEDITDRLIDTHGTVDVDTLQFDQVMVALDDSRAAMIGNTKAPF